MPQAQPREETPPRGGVDLSFLLKGLAELGGVKNHLFLAGREVLLAVQGLLGLVDRYVGSQPNADSQQIVRLFLTYSQKTLRQVVERLPRRNEAEYKQLRQKVLTSILEVLDGEIRRNKPKATTPKGRMKDEVLQAIRTVLIRQMEEYDAV